MITRSGIIRTDAVTRGTTRYWTGSVPSAVSASICSVTRMRAELRRHRASDAPGDHEGRQDGGELARERERDDAADEALRVEPREPVEGLQRHDHPGEERRQEDDRDRVEADPHHLPEVLRHVVGRPDRPGGGLPEHLEETSELLEKPQDGAADRLEEAHSEYTRGTRDPMPQRIS